MSKYYGTDFQIAIQRRMRKRHDWIRDTPEVVNAHVLIDSQRSMVWTHGISQVAPDNPASQKTIVACGFTRDPDLATFGIVRSGEAFTR